MEFGLLDAGVARDSEARKLLEKGQPGTDSTGTRDSDGNPPFPLTDVYIRAQAKASPSTVDPPALRGYGGIPSSLAHRLVVDTLVIHPSEEAKR